jgi:DNA-binding transcriptional LysR family regulator
MNYTLHQLRIFLAIVRTESITKAAEVMHLTQPAVSIQLKNLQEQFDLPLTDVVARKLHITPFGHELALAAKRIIAEVDGINERMLAFKGELSGTLRISSVSTGKYVMPYFLTDFLKQHTGVELQLDVTNKTQVLEQLEQNAIDFALVSILPEKMGIDRIPLMGNRLYLVGGADADETGLLPKDLEKLPFIMREKGSGTRHVTEGFLKAHGVTLNHKMELTSNEAVKQAVMAGLGYSIMPLIGIGRELQRGALRIIPVQGLPLASEWNLIWLRGKAFTPAMKGYADFLTAERERLIERNFSWYEQYRQA